MRKCRSAMLGSAAVGLATLLAPNGASALGTDEALASSYAVYDLSYLTSAISTTPKRAETIGSNDFINAHAALANRRDFQVRGVELPAYITDDYEIELFGTGGLMHKTDNFSIKCTTDQDRLIDFTLRW